MNHLTLLEIYETLVGRFGDDPEVRRVIDTLKREHLLLLEAERKLEEQQARYCSAEAHLVMAYERLANRRGQSRTLHQ